MVKYLYIMKYVLYAFLLYIGYQFIFNFLVPVLRVTKKVKKGFREMQRKMEEQQNTGAQAQKSTPSRPAPPAGDYIEFEELN
jgi:hypothetical protein